jgi:hypothetical protein
LHCDEEGGEALARGSARGNEEATVEQGAAGVGAVAGQHSAGKGVAVLAPVMVGPAQQHAPGPTLAVAGLSQDLEWVGKVQLGLVGIGGIAPDKAAPAQGVAGRQLGRGLDGSRREEERVGIQVVRQRVGKVPSLGQVGRERDGRDRSGAGCDRQLRDLARRLTPGRVHVGPDYHLASGEKGPVRLADGVGAAGPGDHNVRGEALGRGVGGLLALDDQHGRVRAGGEPVEAVERARLGQRAPAPGLPAAVLCSPREREHDDDDEQQWNGERGGAGERAGSGGGAEDHAHP